MPVGDRSQKLYPPINMPVIFPEVFHDLRIGRGEEALDLIQDGDDESRFEVRYASRDAAGKEHITSCVRAELQHTVLFIEIIQEGADLFSLVALRKTGCDLDLQHSVYAVV